MVYGVGIEVAVHRLRLFQKSYCQRLAFLELGSLHPRLIKTDLYFCVIK